MPILGDLIHNISGRLTLESGVPISTSDQTAKTTIYYTPYKGNGATVYNTSAAVWTYLEFTELSLSLSGFTLGKNSDVFLYNNSGTLALERVEWTNDTTRATALTTQDGRYVKSGDASRLYVGTFRTTGSTGQCEDSLTSRFVWNYYNRVVRRLYKTEATSHTYSTASWRAWNNDATQVIKFVIGYAEDAILASIRADVTHSSAAQVSRAGLGIDGAPASVADPQAISNQAIITAPACSITYPPQLGYHYIQISEHASAATGTFAFHATTIQIPM